MLLDWLPLAVLILYLVVAIFVLPRYGINT